MSGSTLEGFTHLVDPFARVISEHLRERVVIGDIAEAPQPLMGESGGDVRIYQVSYRQMDHRQKQSEVACRIVTKNATALEQRILERFTEQKQAVPPLYIPAPAEAKRAAVYMLYAASRPDAEIMSDPHSAATERVARRLAKIHADNRTQCPSWLPQVSANPIRQLWLAETQTQWETCLTDNSFASEFGHYTGRLQRALEQFLDLIKAFTAEGDSLTLVNSDLHPDHIRLFDGDPVFIDWEQACFGSFYLDLVNYFSVESVLLYRDALHEAGHSIPAAEFIDRFREAGRYMGLRYLAVGLLQWQSGGEQRDQGRWFFHYCLTLALHGR